IFNFMNVEWNTGTGIFKSGITLTANTGDGTKDETGILRGVIGADGAVGTFKVSEDPGTGGRTFIGGFVAVPESIGARRGQPAYWAQYARNADNTAGLAVRGVREAKTGDEEYTVIEGGLETLELGLEVAKHATLTNDLTFTNTEVSPDGSTFSFDSTVAGGISVATNAAGNKYYAGLLSGTDVGRILTETPTANWVGRFNIIVGGAVYAEDFELAINFDARTLTSFNPDDSSDAIVLSSTDNTTDTLTIDGEFNDRGVIYGTTTYKFVVGNSLISFAGVLTGLIGEKGAAAVFYSTDAVVKYAGGFIAVPNRGVDFTRVKDTPPASYSIWADGVDATAQKDTNSG
ncbi:MAG: hypothetical protein K8953_03645, partial [Proteobacteria bacterium]|nr:hypothetical protein [Pseudomonadota bacterium]